jgi:Secretory lipase
VSTAVRMDRSGKLATSKRRVPRRLFCVCGSIAAWLLAWALLLAPAAQAAVPPEQDPFYRYEGATPLSAIAPGTVLKTRVESYHVLGIPLPVTAVQLLYRSTGELGQPTVNVTSVLRTPVWTWGPPKVLSYQSFYDSLNPEDEPSYAISGGVTLGGLIPNIESALIAPALLAGESVVVPDTEGETADFSAGPEYGWNTIYALRAALASSATGLRGASKIGLLGYSGGAIATEWAAELAPAYAPDVNSKLVGAAFGGTLVDPAHNLRYVEGSLIWSGTIPIGLIGIGRAFQVDLRPYLNEYGLQLYNSLQRASIFEVLGHYPGLTWAQIAKPQYPTPESIPAYVNDANQLIMGTRGTPSTPLFIGQGAGGELEGTPGNKPGIGPGDGVMIAGDVRTLAREYCSRGVKVQYVEYPSLSHTLAAAQWLPEAGAWLTSRFYGFSAPQDCAGIAPGNSLAPLP